MNYARRQDRALSHVRGICGRDGCTLTLTGGSHPCPGPNLDKLLDDFLTTAQARSGQEAPSRRDAMATSTAGHTSAAPITLARYGKTTPSGTVSVFYSFAAGTGNDCQNGMTLGTDGNFYGTALTSCTGAGYVFKMTPSGTITVLHTFTGTPDGSGPGLLIQYTDGNFYGVTNNGGANNYGTVFKITPSRQVNHPLFVR